MSAPDAPAGMAEWVAAACAELGLDPAEIPVPVVLDLARDVAHGALRPGAPVAAYLVGLAAGRGAAPADAAARLSDLALSWPSTLPGAADAPAARIDPPPA
jgi:Domain of unknown function (DUF6457)